MIPQKPSIPKGTRDFNPEQIIKRRHIFNTIQGVFESFGFQPIETPSFEHFDTLMGKYGDEGDRLIFKILNSGDYLEKAGDAVRKTKNSNALTPYICEKALRYDLTVPFARYIAQHQNAIALPFKRYQIQPVWRADKPQKGRFREFYQCDADVVGSTSLWQEVEFVKLYDTVFSSLRLEGVTIKINNRKLLFGIAEAIGVADAFATFTVVLDKLDKVGVAKVEEELLAKGLPQKSIAKLMPLLELSGTFESQIAVLKTLVSTSEEGKKGIAELTFIETAISELALKATTLKLDPALARGLNYYTGTIFEVSAPKAVQIGAIGGGGRYDDLAGIFGLPHVSGIGISFGLDRIYLVLETLDLFPKTACNSVQVLFMNFGDKEALFCLKTISKLRAKGIKAELYPEASKMKKQMAYANKRAIPFVVLVGEEEVRANVYTLKTMSSGQQVKVSLEALTQHLVHALQ